MKQNMKEKQDAYSVIAGSGIDEEKEVNKARYKIAKNESKEIGRSSQEQCY